jgi:divalent metal cation (Fe/Co/Zn/Cd) transporter
VRIRLRIVDDATLHGDVVIRVPPGMRVSEVNDLIAKAERVIKERFNADVTIALEVASRGEREGKEA